MVKRLSRRNSRSKRNKSRGSKSLRKHIKSRGSKSLRGKNRRSKRMRTQRGGVIGDSTISWEELKPRAVLFLKDTEKIIVILSKEYVSEENKFKIKYKEFKGGECGLDCWEKQVSIKLAETQLDETFSKISGGGKTKNEAMTEIRRWLESARESQSHSGDNI